MNLIELSYEARGLLDILEEAGHPPLAWVPSHERGNLLRHLRNVIAKEAGSEVPEGSPFDLAAVELAKAFPPHYPRYKFARAVVYDHALALSALKALSLEEALVALQGDKELMLEIAENGLVDVLRVLRDMQLPLVELGVFQAAVAARRSDALQWLLDNGVSPDFESSAYGQTLAEIAAGNDYARAWLQSVQFRHALSRDLAEPADGDDSHPRPRV